MNFFYTLLLLLISGFTFSQSVRGLTADPQRARRAANTPALRIAAADTLSLPLFDDFSYYTGNPDPNKWENKGGVYVNREYGLNPPSINMATFDGLNAAGMAYVPYVYNRVQGFADTLTSKPLALGHYTEPDSLYLSFYWQPAGVGEAPTLADGNFIILQFKQPVTGYWINIWKQTPDTNYALDQFYQHTLPLDSEYLYDGFQFRFMSYGSLHGSYDVWNLDYVYLDSNRTKGDTLYPDMALVSYPGSFLKRFKAMPYKQFFANWQNEIVDTLQVTAFNHDSKTANPILMNNKPGQAYFRDEYSNTQLDTFSVYAFAFGQKYTTINLNPPFSTMASMDMPLNVRYSITDTASEPLIYQSNNNLYDSTVIKNYYSYDDNSYEGTYGLSGPGAALAQRFDLNNPDTLTGMLVALVNFNRNYTGSPLIMTVWSDISFINNTETILAAQDISIYYTSYEHLVYYEFDTPVPVSDHFYIGYENDQSNDIHVGIDFNNARYDKVLIKLNGAWLDSTANPYELYGVPLIHPIIGGRDYVTWGTKKPLENFDCQVFPNPTSGQFVVLGAAENAYLQDLSGTTLQNFSFDTSEKHIINLNGNLQAGLYLLRIEGKNGITVKKVTLVK